jgi:2,5-diamino-6-(ribosylamino)-4(3H)-pyrimidinone 5'-phosphate reductase
MTVWLMAAMTLDGKLTGTDGGAPAFVSPLDRRRLMESRARADAVVVGARTVRREDLPAMVDGDDLLAARRAAGRAAQPAHVVVSGSLDLPVAGRVVGNAAQERLVATVSGAPAAARRALEERGVQVLVAGEAAVDAARLLAVLRARGLREVVVEGGGGTNALFLDAGVVDEIHVTIAPVVVGGRDVPTLVEGAGRPQQARLGLELIEAVPQPTGEVFARYRVRR